MGKCFVLGLIQTQQKIVSRSIIWHVRFGIFSKMLIREDGTALGSVGGGCVEGEVWQKAREVIRSGRPHLLSFDLNNEDAANDGLVCGGRVEIFIEPIMSEERLVISEGFRTQLQPAAKAGASFQAAETNAPFHGVISAATPTGSSRVNA